MSYIPTWSRPPNKLIRYERKPFSLPENAHGIVKYGLEIIAVFKDKNGREQEMQAFVEWEN